MFAETLLRLSLQLAAISTAPVPPPVELPTPVEVGVIVAHELETPAPTVEYSEWYYRRLTIHRWGSYTMLPVFAAQYVVGSQLAKGGTKRDGLEDLHPALALGVGALFASNTITGAWNLWDGRKDPNDRKRRFTHATLMMLADAGFLTAAILGDETEDDGRGVGTHRTVAITSMAVATLSWAMMLDAFR